MNNKVVLRVTFQAAWPPCCLGDQDEKQKKEEDFDLIVKHYLGVNVF